jgi:heme a synthase
MLKTELKIIDDFCNMKTHRAHKHIVTWLWAGFGMVFVQILLGAITRLTGSGLSITRWDIVTGIIYPMGEESWKYYFDLYKQTPQFLKINYNMSLQEFKFIFFWEYVHRLWARLMGFVFLIPFIYFYFKSLLDRLLLKRLLVIFLLACIVASLGWIMVASGLVERPWVNAYKLSFHLSTAVALLVYIFYTILKTKGIQIPRNRSFRMQLFLKSLIAFIFLQIFAGGVMAGMKAALSAPSWPLIQGQWIPDVVFQWSLYPDYLFGEYEVSHTGPLIIQFIHRILAYVIFVLILVFSIHSYLRNKQVFQRKVMILFAVCCLQVILGIITLIKSIGFIPFWPAVLHQFFGIGLLIYSVWIYFSYDSETNPDNGYKNQVL